MEADISTIRSALKVKEDGKEKLYILQRMNKDIFKNQKELMDKYFTGHQFSDRKDQRAGWRSEPGNIAGYPYQRGKSLSDRGKW